MKKGFFLAEETLKIILSVIAIGFLAFLLFSLYNTNKHSQELELAKESLDFLIQEIDSQRTEVQIFNPEEWIIISWPHRGIIPNSCSNLGWTGCVCISEDVSLIVQTFSGGSLFERFSEKSDEGVCLENDFSVKKDGVDVQPIVIEDAPLNLKINYEEKVISRSV